MTTAECCTREEKRRAHKHDARSILFVFRRGCRWSIVPSSSRHLRRRATALRLSGREASSGRQVVRPRPQLKGRMGRRSWLAYSDLASRHGANPGLNASTSASRADIVMRRAGPDAICSQYMRTVSGTQKNQYVSLSVDRMVGQEVFVRRRQRPTPACSACRSR